MGVQRADLTLREYLRRTRGGSFTIIMVVSLLCVYEFGLLVGGGARRNAADALLKDVLEALGPHGVAWFHGALLLLFAGAIAVYVVRSRSVVRYLLPFTAECLTYAALLTPAVLFVARPALESGAGEDLLLDVGAGVYEEIVFRLLVLRGSVFLLGIDPYVAFFEDARDGGPSAFAIAGSLVAPVLISSFLFAAYHHVGVDADPWTWPVFTFRFIAGLLLAQLYFVRGLAVCVFSHALYDVLIHLAVN